MKKIDLKSRAFWIDIVARVLMLAAALILFKLYYGPLRVKILNAGNGFGLAVALILVLAAIFLTPLCNFIKKLWKSKKGRRAVTAAAAVILIGITVFTSTLVSVINCSEYSASDETTVIVLGCRIWGSKPSSALKARVKAASDYMSDHPEAVAVLSGGQGPDEDLSEAQCMYNLMLENGIDSDRLYLEDKSTSTDENIAFSKKIIEENNLSQNVAVATTDYHQKRAIMICEKNGLEASSLPSDSGKDTKATFFTREVFGVWAQWLKMILK